MVGQFFCKTLFFWFMFPVERREGRVHGHHVRGGVQPGEACADRTPGARPARAHSSAAMEERKQDRSEEWGKIRICIT